MKVPLLTVLLVTSSLGVSFSARGVGEQTRPAPREDKDGRATWILQQRTGPTGRLPVESLRRTAERRALAAAPAQEAADVPWEPIGPDPIRGATWSGGGPSDYGGRALAIALDPARQGTLLMGAAQGGIWRSTDSGASWKAVGDGLPSLAIKVIRFAPSDPSIVYAGSGEPHSKTSIWGMGVFRSTDGGATWGALPASGKEWDFRYLAVSGLEVHPKDPKTLWVTTADVLQDRVDAFEAPPSAAEPGIFRSTDGGATWRRLKTAVDYRANDYAAYDPYLASGYGFVDLALFAADPKVLFAVERSGGIYRTTDGGESWTLATPQKNPGAGEASGGAFPAPVTSFGTYVNETGTFTAYPVLKRARRVPEFNRIELGLGQAGGRVTSDWRTTVLYASYGALLQLDADGDGVFDSSADLTVPVALLFKSTDGGQTWKWLGDLLRSGVPHYCDPAPGGSENALYDNTVDVNPENPDDVVVAGNANYTGLWPDPVAAPTRLLEVPWTGTVFRSLDGGASWVDTTPVCLAYELDPDKKPVGGLPLYRCAQQAAEKGTHPDTHAAAFDWKNRLLYIANDGGLAVCSVTGDGTDSLHDYHWKPLNGNVATLQVFQLGSHPTDPDRVIVGTQDNATAVWDGEAWQSWDWHESDGTVARWDPKAPRHVYVGWQYALARHDHGGNPSAKGWKKLFDGSIGLGDGFPFVVIFDIDPVKTSTVYVGSLTGVYRSTDRGDHWAERLNVNPTDGQVTALAVSPKNPRYVWAGTSTGHVYLFDTKKGRVTDLTGNFLPNRWVSAIVPSARDVDRVVIAFSGYDATSTDRSHGGNGNAGRVFRSRDRGETWDDASGNLTGENGLDVPVSALAQDPEDERRLFAGTDLGVFETRDGGGTWRSARGKMPLVAVTGLDLNRKTGYLLAGTFGRGVWRIRYRR